MRTEESLFQIEGERKDTSLIAPLESVEVKVDKDKLSAGDKVSVQIFDGEGNRYVDEPLESATIVFEAGGVSGKHRVNLVSGSGKRLATELFTLKPETDVRTDSPDFDRFFRWLGSMMLGEKLSFFLKGQPVTCHCTWIRDNTHMMKGAKYWDNELRSFVQHMLDVQCEDGVLYDFVSYMQKQNAKAVDEQVIPFVKGAKKPLYLLTDEDMEVYYVRCTAEADVEYLEVEAAYTIWQTTGDDKWIKAQLPKLEKALNYHLTDPTRWCPEYGLVKRPYTIDTYDSPLDNWPFYGPITDYPHFAIMHGDNSGMYQACSQLAKLYKHSGDEDRGNYWEEKASMFRENMNRVCWNGRFYTHMVAVDPPPLDEEELALEPERLSFSNPYDINRGVASPEQAASVIREYQSRREQTKDTHFAEWFSIHPPYKHYHQHGPWQYVNGGIMSQVAGELTKAALDYSFEDYGADIIRRLMAKLEEDHVIRAMYSPEGKINTSVHGEGEPRKWGIATIISAIVESMIGVRDEGKLFQNVLLQPRWEALGIKKAKVVVNYAASDAYFAYCYELDEKNGTICIRWTGNADTIRFHIFLPENAEVRSVISGNKKVTHTKSGTRERPYVDFSLQSSTGTVQIRM